jgi:hypothetical protein
MEHLEFALFPTQFHQQRESVMPAAQARYDAIAKDFPPATLLRVEYWASVVEHHQIDSFDVIKRLAGQHVWRDEVLADRFDWGREKGIYAIVVRVYRPSMTVEMPMIPEYGGCKSWIELAHPIPRGESTPALSDAIFEQKLRVFRDTMAGSEPLPK